MKNNSYNEKMKYFIVQSIASSILISSMSTQNVTEMLFTYTLATMSLIMKLGAIPMHSWYCRMLKKLSWKLMLILMTIQKILGIYLMSFTKSKVEFMALAAIVTSTIIQTNKTNFLENLAISSLFNMGLMMLCISLSMSSTAIFIFMYILATLQILLMSKMLLSMKETQQNKMNMNKFLTMSNLANLAGIPPSLGFLSKWLISMEMSMKNKMASLTLMLSMSSMNLYVYMRCFINKFMKLTKNNQQSTTHNTKTKMMILLNTIFTPVMLMTL